MCLIATELILIIPLFLGNDIMHMQLPQHQLVRWTGLFEDCWKQLEYGWSIPGMVYVSQTIRLMLSIIYLQCAHANVTPKQSRYIEKAVEYMKERISKQLSLDDLAQYINVSKSHLITLFNKTKGYPPLEYFLRMKIQQACRELDFTEQTIKEISIRLGFTDPYYFSRQFRKVMGQSPASYRKTTKG
jgi:AraC-like DNA-binding protein